MPKQTRKSQRQKILELLTRERGLTADQARNLIGSRRLAARIFELRREGHVIECDRIKAKNSDETYGRYRLVKSP